ncbi:hypothetical protein TWF281_003293 [Arthrobotrys megalospora]
MAESELKEHRRNLLDLPVELVDEILKDLPPADLRRFAHSSRFCYSFTLSARFKSIILNPVSIEVFRDGGLCARSRDSIRSVHLKGSKTGNSEKNFHELRACIEALGLFPNLKELRLSYRTPKEMEANTYIAVMSRIARYEFCNTLEHLELRVSTKSFANLWPEPWPSVYSRIYSSLSASNQEFIGELVTQIKVEQLIKEKSPKFPALRSASISRHFIPTPLVNPGTRRLQRSEIYYIPLTFAPNIRELTVESGEPHNIMISCNDNQGFSTEILNMFSQITDLKILQSTVPSEEQFERLAERLPNLETLDIRLSDPRKQENRYYGPYPFDKICESRNLKKVTLPWPADYPRNINSNLIIGWVSRWKAAGVSGLNTVMFRDSRYIHHNGTRENVIVSFTTAARGGEWEMVSQPDTHVATSDEEDEG